MSGILKRRCSFATMPIMCPGGFKAFRRVDCRQGPSEFSTAPVRSAGPTPVKKKIGFNWAKGSRAYLWMDNIHRCRPPGVAIKKILGLSIHSRRRSLFTKNRVKAAPVLLDMELMKSGVCQAIIVNSGNANCCTGEQGHA